MLNWKLLREVKSNSNYGPVLDQQKNVSLFLDGTGLPAAQQRDSSRLKSKDTSFCCSRTHPISFYWILLIGVRVTDSRLVSNLEILKTCNLEFLVILKILITGSVNLEVLILNFQDWQKTKFSDVISITKKNIGFFGSALEKLLRSILSKIKSYFFSQIDYN